MSVSKSVLTVDKKIDKACDQLMDKQRTVLVMRNIAMEAKFELAEARWLRVACELRRAERDLSRARRAQKARNARASSRAPLGAGA